MIKCGLGRTSTCLRHIYVVMKTNMLAIGCLSKCVYLSYEVRVQTINGEQIIK